MSNSIIPAALTVGLRIEGMTCASCVARIERGLMSVPGVVSASVNLATERAAIRYAAGAVSHARLEVAVRAAGYEVIGPAQTKAAEDGATSANRLELVESVS